MSQHDEGAPSMAEYPAATEPVAPAATTQPMPASGTTQPMPASGTTQPMPASGTTQPAAAPAAAPSGPRTGAIVGGLVLVLLGLGVTAIGAGATLDLQAALIVLLMVAGVALLLGAVLSARRRDRG